LGKAGDRCCDKCNATVVVPERFASVSKRPSDDTDGKEPVSKRVKLDDNDDGEEDRAFFCSRETNKTVNDDIKEEDCSTCEPGIEAEFSTVPHGLKRMFVAVKPPCASERIAGLEIDVLVACDGTASMRGDGARGLRSTLKNFDILVQKSLKAAYPEASEETLGRVRASTNLHLFRFDQSAEAFEGYEGFVSFAENDLREVCNDVSKKMTFDGICTNIHAATKYAREMAKQRFLDKKIEDTANGTKRLVCFVLLTDGAANNGVCNTNTILTEFDSELSDVFPHAKTSIFAVGLGEATERFFLTSLCRGGYWKHVKDAYDPSEAFEVAFGTILSCVDTYNVSMKLTVEREGTLLEETQCVSEKYIGMMNAASCRARIMQVPIPREAVPGDVVVMETTFGLGGQPMTSRVCVGIDPSQGATSGISGNVEGSNMVDGLYAEASDIEHAMCELKRRISNGETIDQISNGFEKVGNTSYAVRSHMNRYCKILGNSLEPMDNNTDSVAMSMASSFHTAYAGSFGGHSMAHSIALPGRSSSYTPHSVEASFSQIYSS
jgi:hypothetical protein